MPNPDRYLLESSTTDGYLLEDGSGVYVLDYLACYQAAVLADNPIGYWPLSERSGTVALDLTANANHGTYTNGVTLGAAGPITGMPDTAATFTAASNQYVSIPNSTPLQLGDGPMSYELWVKWSGAVLSQWFVVKGTQFPALFLTNAGVIEPQAFAWSAEIHSSIALDTSWRYVVFTKGVGPSWLVSVDAVPCTVIDATDFATTISTSNPLLVGSDNAGSPFDGSLAHFAVYSTILTPTQQQTHFATIATACQALPYVNPMPPLIAQ